jgi:hypothetical protein
LETWDEAGRGKSRRVEKEEGGEGEERRNGRERRVKRRREGSKRRDKLKEKGEGREEMNPGVEGEGLGRQGG